MDAVKEDVKKLMLKELDAANKIYPLFASPHEGYAVIKEEYEELKEEINPLVWVLDCLWNDVRYNKHSDDENCIDTLYDHAVAAACEAVQVAAMCEKYRMSMGKWDCNQL